MFSDFILCFGKRFDSKIIIKVYLLLFLSLTVFFCISACNNKDSGEGYPRREVSAYSEKTINTAPQFSLDMECDFGNLEFYRWERQEIKFEVTHKVRESKPVDELSKLLGYFSIKATEKAGKVSFICNYKERGGKYENTFSVVRVFLPRKPVSVNCRLIQGRMTFYDDLETILKLDAVKAEININKLTGKVNYTGDDTYFNISAGYINSNSSVVTKNGNIRIRADFEIPGTYTINTGTGIVALDLPESLNAVFENNGMIDTPESTESAVCSRFLIKQNVGKVDISRF